MKVIKYEIMTEVNCGTKEKPNIVQNFTPVSICCKTEHLESNEEIARREAYNGEYTIEDDGVEESVEYTAQDDTDAMIIDHEYRLTLLELGITEY